MNLFRASSLYAITAEKLSGGRSDVETAAQMLQGGIRFLQYREKDKTARAMYDDCVAIRALTQRYRAAFIVDDLVGLALAVGADGVHIGQDDLPPAVVRQIVGNDMVIGLSTHDRQQLTAANGLGSIIDYVGCGPVYATQTKANPAPVTGLDYIRYAAAASQHPFVAIGGIKASNIQAVYQAGARHMALVSELTGAADIAAKIGQLQELVREGGQLGA